MIDKDVTRMLTMGLKNPLRYIQPYLSTPLLRLSELAATSVAGAGGRTSIRNILPWVVKEGSWRTSASDSTNVVHYH